MQSRIKISMIGSAVSLDHDTLLALNLSRAVAGLYKIPDLKGLLSLQKEASKRAKILRCVSVNDVSYILGNENIQLHIKDSDTRNG